MTLLLTVFAAILSTYIWYQKDQHNRKCIGTLALMYWGASLMWFVDAIFAYIEEKASYFTPAPAALLNDFFLGLCVIAFGLLIWLILFLLKDPDNVIHSLFQQH